MHSLLLSAFSKSYRHLILFIAFSITLSSCALTSSTHGARGYTEKGKASYYGGKFHGRKMANGERFNKNKMTAAHKTLPFGTKVKVTNLETRRSVKVQITDRGPFVKGRIIDVSEAAARKLDFIDDGVVPVKMKVIKSGKKR